MPPHQNNLRIYYMLQRGGAGFFSNLTLGLLILILIFAIIVLSTATATVSLKEGLGGSTVGVGYSTNNIGVSTRTNRSGK